MKYKVGDKVKIKENIINNHFIPNETIKYLRNKFEFLTIGKCSKDLDNNWYEIEEDDLMYSWHEDMLEDVEEEEMTIGQVIDNLMNNPDIIIKKITKLTEECKKVNEDLKIELKNKQSEIDFLKGQVSVYEKFLKCKEV